jgi:hypothetical protein
MNWGTSIDWNLPQYLCFCDSGKTFSRFNHVAGFPSFLRLSNSTFYLFIYLFIHWLIDTWIFVSGETSTM